MKKEPDPRIVYADIIGLPHWESPTRPRMSLYDRAAQFLSYKALTGFEDMVAEEARLTDERTEMGSHDLALLNQKLGLIADAVAAGEHPVLTFTVFVPDKKKMGGKYEEVTSTVKSVDPVWHKVVLAPGEGRGKPNRSIRFENIVSIRGELVTYLDEA